MKIKWSKYIPKDKVPTGKQLAFLSLDCEEALYGGAAGGGKSEALLFDALRFADVPGFAAIIFRRTIEDAELPNSVLSRAKEWLSPYLSTGEVKFHKNKFIFPSGAKIAFGYLKNAGDQYRYKGSEYHRILFDELTQFYEPEYEYLFSRIRGTVDQNIPTGMRAATNPGDVGHLWVKKRFKITYDADLSRWVGKNPAAPFIQARLDDNPYVAAQYADMLAKLGKVERERLLNGDWAINEDALFEKHWFTSRYFQKSNGYYNLPTKDGIKAWHPDELFLFTTVDCAASVKTGVKGKSFSLTKPKSCASVISTWGLTPDHDLLWLDNWRGFVSIPSLYGKIVENHKIWKPLYNIIEKNGPGEGVCQFVEKKGLPIKPINTALDKVKNSITAQLRAEQGKIWLPEWANWLPEVEDEVFTWTGSPDAPDDIVDTLSNAANEAMYLSFGHEKDRFLRQGLKRAIPYASASVTGQSYLGTRARTYPRPQPPMMGMW